MYIEIYDEMYDFGRLIRDSDMAHINIDMK